MMEDSIVDEVQEARRRIFEECEGDLNRFIDRIKNAELKDKDRLVTVQDVRKRASQSKTAV